MAKDTNRVLEGTIDAFKRLKEEIKRYKDELATLTIGTEEWNKAAQKLANAQKQVDAINKAARGNLNAYNQAQTNSINELKTKIKLLNQERNAMDMNSKEYAEATKQLKVLNDQLREAGTSAGDWKANVGNYANSIKDAFADLGTAAGGLMGSMGGLNASMLKLASNPVGAAILAITTAIKAFAYGIKSSEDNTNKWREALIPLRTILVMIQNAIQDLTGRLLDYVNGLERTEKQTNAIKTALQVIITMFEQTKTRIHNLKEGISGIVDSVKGFVDRMKDWADGLKKTFSPVVEFVDNIADRVKSKLQPVVDWIIDKYNKLAKTDLGKVFGLQTIEQVKASWEKAGEVTEKVVENYTQTGEKVRKVTKAENELASAIAGLTMRQAELGNEVERYNREYREALEDKDYSKAQDALNKKKEAEIELAKVGVSIAKVQADLMREQMSLTQNSAEAEIALAQATAEVTRAQGQVQAAIAGAAREQTKLNKTIEAAAKSEQADKFKDAISELNKALNELTANYNNALNILSKPIKPEGASIDTNSINEYYDAIIANAEAEYTAYQKMIDDKIVKLQEFIEVQKAAGNDVRKYEEDLAKYRMEQSDGYLAQQKKLNEEITKANIERAKTQKALQKSEMKGYADLFDSVSDLFEENTIAYKATATAKALINTYLAATGALADTPGGAVARGIAMAATLAAGLAQVIQIWKINPTGENNIGGTTSTPSVAEPVMEQTNPYSYSRQVQTYEEEDELNRPIIVKVSDINAVQERVRVVDAESSF